MQSEDYYFLHLMTLFTFVYYISLQLVLLAIFQNSIHEYAQNTLKQQPKYSLEAHQQQIYVGPPECIDVSVNKSIFN